MLTLAPSRAHERAAHGRRKKESGAGRGSEGRNRMEGTGDRGEEARPETGEEARQETREEARQGTGKKRGAQEIDWCKSRAEVGQGGATKEIGEWEIVGERRGRGRKIA